MKIIKETYYILKQNPMYRITLTEYDSNDVSIDFFKDVTLADGFDEIYMGGFFLNNLKEAEDFINAINGQLKERN